MLALARQSLVSAARSVPPPDIAVNQPAPRLTEKKGCFVTLTSNGSLRGCVGHIFPRERLDRAIVENARNAALNDPRFPAVQPDEVAGIKIGISVLTEPQPLHFSSAEELLEKLRPGEDGVLFRYDGQIATFLPQVWTMLPDKVEFLNHLSEKAGCAPSAWRLGGTSICIYHAESFEEVEAAIRSG